MSMHFRLFASHSSIWGKIGISTKSCLQYRIAPQNSMQQRMISGSNPSNGHHFNGSTNVCRRYIVPVVAGTLTFFTTLRMKDSLISAVYAAKPLKTIKPPTPQSDPPKYYNNSFADIVEQCIPAVVQINSRKMGLITTTFSQGSGIIIDSNGLILTNAHVVFNSPDTGVVVKLHDGTEFEGRVEVVDESLDLATIQINSKDLPTMKLGKSEEVRAGDWVVALGSPLTMTNTVTAGVVSSVHRPTKIKGAFYFTVYIFRYFQLFNASKINVLFATDKTINFIQTDAAITYGSSGGPLLNWKGEAVAITSKSCKNFGGISLAIPMSYAHEFLERCKLKRRDHDRMDNFASNPFSL